MVDANDGGNNNLGLAQVFGVRPCQDIEDVDSDDDDDGANGNLGLAQVVRIRSQQGGDDVDVHGGDVDVDDGGGANLGLAQVVGIRSWQDGDGHCDGTEVVEETKNKPDPEKNKKIMFG